MLSLSVIRSPRALLVALLGFAVLFAMPNAAQAATIKACQTLGLQERRLRGQRAAAREAVVAQGTEAEHARPDERPAEPRSSSHREQAHDREQQQACRRQQEGLDEQLENFIKEHPDTKLVIIDTMQKIREAGGEAYSYASDYEIIGRLKQGPLSRASQCHSLIALLQLPSGQRA